MSEQKNFQPSEDTVEDVDAHVSSNRIAGPDTDDVEGHGASRI
jgi:hypothetical protein